MLCFHEKNASTYVSSAETRRANPGEVLTDLSFLGKIKDIILNKRILVPWDAILFFERGGNSSYFQVR